MAYRVAPPLTPSPAPGVARNVLPLFFPCPQGMGEPTFTFVTKDSQFYVQYYWDWRAPSEQTAMDKHIRDTYGRPVTARNRVNLIHCRDPQLGTGQLYLYHILAQVDGHSVVDWMATNHPRYRLFYVSKLVCDRHRAVLREEEAKPLHERSARVYREATDMVRRYNEQIGRLDIQFRDERVEEETRSRAILLQKKADIERMIERVMRDHKVRFSLDDRDLVDDCRNRGDSAKVQEMVDRKVRARAGNTVLPYR